MSMAGWGRTEIGACDLLNRGIRDGEADLQIEGNNAEITARVRTPFTLWYPKKVESPFRLSFDCRIRETNTKMLLFFCATGNRGASVSDWRREGKYTDYASGMQTYSLGLNRGKHSGSRQFSPFDPEGRDDLANLRRLGLDEWSETHDQKSREELQHLKSRNPKSLSWHTPTWLAWNRASTICSSEEPESGLHKWICHTIRCRPPYIAYDVNDRLVFEVVDHRQPPLRAGFIGFRCMSPGKLFHLRNIVLETAGQKDD